MFTKSCGPPSWLPEDALCHIKVLHTGRTGRTWQQRFILSEEGCRYGLRRRNTSGLKWGVCICMMGGDAWCGGYWTGARHCCRCLLLIGQCSQCPGHSLWEEAGRRRRPSLAAGLQRAQGPKLDWALWKTSPGLESERKESHDEDIIRFNKESTASLKKKNRKDFSCCLCSQATIIMQGDIHTQREHHTNTHRNNGHNH